MANTQFINTEKIFKKTGVYRINLKQIKKIIKDPRCL